MTGYPSRSQRFIRAAGLDIGDVGGGPVHTGFSVTGEPTVMP